MSEHHASGAEAEHRSDRIAPSTRIDGWTGARQKRFLEAVADGETVRDACQAVAMSPSSAYAFRRRAAGRAFDLGWKTADLLARERVAADLLIRSGKGQTVEITRPDGSIVTRHHYDNRLAKQMLDRLDRYADASENGAPGHAARLVAGDFDAYLDVIGREGDPARAGLFMLARGSEGEGVAAEIEPVVALARADRMLRCGTAAEVATADLDPARRAGWTAEQWTRAEAAGIVALAPAPATPEPAPEDASTRELRSTCSASEDAPVDGSTDEEPLFWDASLGEWRTVFPPPDGFGGEEDGEYGDPEYSRQLDDDETAALFRPHQLGVAAKRVLRERDRARFFAEAARVEGMDDVEPEDLDPGRFDRAALENLAAWAGMVNIPDLDEDAADAVEESGRPTGGIISEPACIPPGTHALRPCHIPSTTDSRRESMADTSNDITVVNSLIKTLNDSVTGYQESAKDIGNQRLATMFQERAQERQQVVTQLQAEVARLGGDPNSSGSLLGSAHQIFLDLKSTITGKDDSAVLAEVQRGEEYLRDKFDTALADANLGASTRQVLEQAAQSVRRGADQVSQFNTAM